MMTVLNEATIFSWYIVVVLIDCSGNDLMKLATMRSPLYYRTLEACAADVDLFKICNKAAEDVKLYVCLRRKKVRINHCTIICDTIRTY